jgi:hypothetical protein
MIKVLLEISEGGVFSHRKKQNQSPLAECQKRFKVMSCIRGADSAPAK